MIQILVVEDDVELNKNMCKSLEKGGYHAYGCRFWFWIQKMFCDWILIRTNFHI